jgi:HSP20 family molecular chaperone IbpA
MATDIHPTGPSRRSSDRRPFVAPPVDVYENADEILLVADMPGVTEEGLNIELDRGELRIEGSRSTELHGNAVETGERFADYRRAFTVPDSIDAEKVKAVLTQGVLKVHLPKAPHSKPRRIAVKAS